MNARNKATVDGDASLEAATPPTKESYPSYSVPWYRQGKWRIFMLIGGILIIGAIVGGVVGGTVSKNNKNNKVPHGPTTTLNASLTTFESAQPTNVVPSPTPTPSGRIEGTSTPNSTTIGSPSQSSTGSSVGNSSRILLEGNNGVVGLDLAPPAALVA